MSTEKKLEKVLKRVEQGLTTYYDCVWLRAYYSTLQKEIEDYATQLKEARAKLNALEYYVEGNG